MGTWESIGVSSGLLRREGERTKKAGHSPWDSSGTRPGLYGGWGWASLGRSSHGRWGSFGWDCLRWTSQGWGSHERWEWCGWGYLR